MGHGDFRSHWAMSKAKSTQRTDTWGVIHKDEISDFGEI